MLTRKIIGEWSQNQKDQRYDEKISKTEYPTRQPSRSFTESAADVSEVSTGGRQILRHRGNVQRNQHTDDKRDQRRERKSRAGKWNGSAQTERNRAGGSHCGHRLEEYFRQTDRILVKCGAAGGVVHCGVSYVLVQRVQ